VSFGSGCIAGTPASLGGSAELPRTVDVASSGDVSEVEEVIVDISVIEAEVTHEHTATLEVTLRNDADRTRRFYGGSSFPFGGVTSHPRGLILLDADSERGTKTDDCWIVETPNGWRTVETRASLDPGEAASTRMTVWHDPRSSGCMPPGEYHFEESLSVGESAEDATVFTWEFDLSVFA
jgi:hypothetical protein